MPQRTGVRLPAPPLDSARICGPNLVMLLPGRTSPPAAANRRWSGLLRIVGPLPHCGRVVLYSRADFALRCASGEQALVGPPPPSGAPSPPSAVSVFTGPDFAACGGFRPSGDGIRLGVLLYWLLVTGYWLLATAT